MIFDLRIAILAMALSAGTPSICLSQTAAPRDTSFRQIDTKMKAAAMRLKQKTAEIHAFIKTGDYCDDYCFMVDMSVPSGKKRFFVVNLKTDQVEMSSLVSHGAGSYKPDCKDVLTFSNELNSNATSLGKYKIGASYTGEWGPSYRLYGLDPTNSNAYDRAVVLHSDPKVPNTENFPRHIYESNGCPTVSPSIFAILGKYISTATKPVLLWIYN